MTTGTAYRPDIDGLRALAVLPVILYHAFPDFLDAGFLGVDVFFVISGFLITRIILAEIEQSTFSLRGFYARRVRRIFPALATVLLSVALFGAVFLFPLELANLGTHLIGGATFSSNFILWTEIGYFDTSAWEKVLLHLWSLAVEEQFYIIWPVILLVSARRVGSVLALSAVLLLASLVGYLIISLLDADAAFYASPLRFWELLFGAVLASQRSGVGLSQTARTLLAALALILLIIAYKIVDKSDESFPCAVLIVVLSATVLVWLGPDNWVSGRILSNRILVWFGLISYPLYLWHWPILAYLRISDGGGRAPMGVLEGLSALGLATLLAFATYRWVERPIRFRKGPWVVPGLVASVAGLGVVGLVFQVSGGLPSRVAISPPSGAQMFQPYPHPQSDATCGKVVPELADLWACVSSAAAPPDIVLIGDSHANQYYLALSAQTNKTVLNLGVPGCLPFNGLGTADCQDKQRRVLTYLDTLPRDTAVVLTGYFSVLSAGGLAGENIEGSRVARPLNAQARGIFFKNAQGFLSRLAESGKPVYWLQDIPDLMDRPIGCLSIDNRIVAHLRAARVEHLTAAGDDCFLSRAGYETRMAPYDALERDLFDAFAMVRVLFIRDLFCDADRCYALRRGVLLYWNSDHLTIDGASLVVDRLLQRFPELRADPR